MPEGRAELLGDVEGLLDGQAMTLAVAEVLLEIATRDVLADQIDAPFPLVDVVHGDDVRVVSEAPHRLGLASHPGQVEPLVLDEGDGHIPVESRVPGQVDALLRALPEKALEAVAAARERIGLGGGTSGGLGAELPLSGLASSGLPHSSQNRWPRGLSVSQVAQRTVVERGCPHAPQNLADSRFSWLQEGQFTCDPDRLRPSYHGGRPVAGPGLPG